jgi:hypothetical protein
MIPHDSRIPFPMNMPSMAPDRKVDQDISGELLQLIRALVRRVEILEKHVGLTKTPEQPCIYCNVLGNHQPWCEANAKRV